MCNIPRLSNKCNSVVTHKDIHPTSNNACKDLLNRLLLVSKVWLTAQKQAELSSGSWMGMVASAAIRSCVSITKTTTLGTSTFSEDVSAHVELPGTDLLPLTVLMKETAPESDQDKFLKVLVTQLVLRAFRWDASKRGSAAIDMADFEKTLDKYARMPLRSFGDSLKCEFELLELPHLSIAADLDVSMSSVLSETDDAKEVVVVGDVAAELKGVNEMFDTVMSRKRDYKPARSGDAGGGVGDGHRHGGNRDREAHEVAGDFKYEGGGDRDERFDDGDRGRRGSLGDRGRRGSLVPPMIGESLQLVDEAITEEQQKALLSTLDLLDLNTAMEDGHRAHVGRFGEKYASFILKNWLEKDPHNATVRWMNEDSEAGNPYDFEIIFRDGKKKFCEVKTRVSDQPVSQWAISIHEVAEAMNQSEHFFCLLISLNKNYEAQRIEKLGFVYGLKHELLAGSANLVVQVNRT